MKINVPAVAKVNNKWFIGFLNGYKFESIKEISKLSDVKDVSEYKGLITFLRTNGLERDLADTILKKTGCNSIYVLDKPIDLSLKQFESYWWMDHHKLCKTCKKYCKQSYMIKELFCKDYQKE